MDNYQGSAGFGIAFDVSFLFDIIYISVFFIFMCQCVYFMLLLLYMFKNLKKMNILCIFYACFCCLNSEHEDVALKIKIVS